MGANLSNFLVEQEVLRCRDVEKYCFATMMMDRCTFFIGTFLYISSQDAYKCLYYKLILRQEESVLLCKYLNWGRGGGCE